MLTSLAVIAVTLVPTSPSSAATLCNGLTVTIDIGLGDSPTPGNDVIAGTPGDDNINGLAGDDVICGGDGNDTISGSTGNDHIFGEGGNDSLFGQTGEDHLNGGAGDDTAVGMDGDDVLIGGDGNDTLNGSADNDTLNGGSGNDNLYGQQGNDTLFGLAGADHLDGGDGDDIAIGMADNDVLLGGGGNDTLNGGDGDDTVDGGGGNDSLYGQQGNDTMTGGDGNDLMTGSDGVDTMSGGDGDDTMNAGPGDDLQLHGDAGNDTLYGGPGADLDVDGGPDNDLVFGQLGDDTLQTGTGDDSAWGNEGNDSIEAIDGNNTLNGGPDDDTIVAGPGNDAIYGDGDLLQAGDDTLTGGDGADTILGFAGDDIIMASDSTADTVNGGPDDNLCYTDGVDTVFNCTAPPPPGPIPFTEVIVDSAPPWQSHVKALGDLNGDGWLDIVVGGARTGEGLFWYDYPSWTKHTIVPPGTGFTTDMLTTDVDGDGDADIVVAKGWNRGESLWWYENPSESGDPRVDPWTEHEIGTAESHDIEAADFDQDGRIDFVVRDTNTTIFLQTAPDTWTQVGLGDQPIEGTAVGDLDDDGDADIVVGRFWLENPLPGSPVTGTWTKHTITGAWPVAAAASLGDINEDGNVDVVLGPSEVAVGRLSWFEAPADPTSGTWTEHVIDPLVEYFHQFQVADFDLDGDLDIATAEMHQAGAPQEVSVYRNADLGATWTQEILSTGGSHNIQSGDIEGDGDIDLMGVNWDGATPVKVWRNDIIDSPHDDWSRQVIDTAVPQRTIFVHDADIDGDGDLDVVSGAWWFENPGSIAGNWIRRTIGSPVNQMAIVHDFDEDGDLDILGTRGIGSAANANFAWAENDGSGSFTIRTNIDSGQGSFLQGVTAARFNGPIQVVLSWQNGVGGLQELTVPSDPTTGTWTWSQLSPTSLGEGITHGDIDDDGDLDISLGLVWLRNDNTSWSQFTMHTPTEGESDRTHLVDMDGDGDLDSLVGYGHDDEGKLAWYENPTNSTGAWTEHLMANLVNPQSVDVADLDGDGDYDVVAGEHRRLPDTDPDDAQLLIFENLNQLGTSWRQHLVDLGDEHHDGAQLADFDGDGDYDVVSIGWVHRRLAIYENLEI